MKHIIDCTDFIRITPKPAPAPAPAPHNPRGYLMAGWLLLGIGFYVPFAFLIAGCQEKEPKQAFFPEDSSVTPVLDAQAARGARADANLQAIHFDGPALNSLGRGKLDAMLRDSAPLPLDVYITAPEDQYPRYSGAVKDYLFALGLEPANVQIHPGPNPATLHPAGPTLQRLPKTENPPGQATAAREEPMQLPQK